MTRPVTDLQRTVAPFEVVSDYVPAGDQPQAIEEIARRIEAGEGNVVLLGATAPASPQRQRGWWSAYSGRRW